MNGKTGKLWNRLKELWYRLTRRWGVFYVNGPQSLPPPLTAQQEQEIMKRISAGELQCRNELITHNLRLVVYIAKKFDTASAGAEDLISIGTIGLIKAVNTFTPEKNIKLATYASRCIENEILMYLRKSSNRRQDASIDEPLNVDGEGNELLLGDILCTDADDVGRKLEENAEYDALLRAVSELDDRERLIMRLRFGLEGSREYTQKEVADRIGISQSYISRLEKKILDTLRRRLQREL